MNPIVVIPARMASTRLPGKPLADIAGLPMIVRVWRQAIAADIGPVVVAAGDADIAKAIVDAGGKAVMTPPDLRLAPTGCLPPCSRWTRKGSMMSSSIFRAICPRSIRLRFVMLVRRWRPPARISPPGRRD